MKTTYKKLLKKITKGIRVQFEDSTWDQLDETESVLEEALKRLSEQELANLCKVDFIKEAIEAAEAEA